MEIEAGQYKEYEVDRDHSENLFDPADINPVPDSERYSRFNSDRD